MADVMWADAAGRRTLLAPSSEVGAFVSGVYSFEEVAIVDFEILETRPDRLHLRAGPLQIELHGGKALRLFALRPRRLRHSARWVRFEDAVLRPVVGRVLLHGAAGVRAYGVTATGVREWYRIDEYRPVVRGWARVNDVDLGALGPLDPPAGFGFSEFPRRPAIVRCSPLLEGAERFLQGPSDEGGA